MKQLKLSVSLWSADLGNLASAVRQAEPYADSFHIDVADGTFTPKLLFFPDLVHVLTEISAKPFEAHLITREPHRWLVPFAEAGVKRIIFYPEVTSQPSDCLERIRDLGLQAGMSVSVEQPLSMLRPYWELLDMVVILGTGFGVKGVNDIPETVYQKIEQLVKVRGANKLAFQIVADGAIRRHTVPRLKKCGVDTIVPGSLFFKNDPDELMDWLRSV